LEVLAVLEAGGLILLVLLRGVGEVEERRVARGNFTPRLPQNGA
jgi:hypothetical protein